MGVGAAVFNSAGKRTEHYVPGVYLRSNNVTSAGGVSSGNLCLLGDSKGGEPGVLYQFGTLAEAKETLGSGELLNSIAFAFNGSRDYIPQSVFAMRVNKATQGTLTLTSEISGSDTELYKLHTSDFGTQVNQMKFRVDTGSTAGSKKITLAYKDDTVVIDDIKKECLNIIYNGSGSASVTVSADKVVFTETEDDTPQTYDYSFADFNTLGQLAARINDDGIFTVFTVSDESENANILDTVSDVTITDRGITLNADADAFVKAVESIGYISKVEKLTENRIVPDNTLTFVYFGGGSAEETSNDADWADALTILETKDIQIISTSVTSESIQNLIVNHCVQMSTTVNRKERTCILGGAEGENDDNAIATAKTFNSELVSYVTDGATVVNPMTGKKEVVSGAILAVMCAGMEAAMSPNIPLTNKTLNIVKFTKTRSIANMKKLIKGGVMVCNPSPENMGNYVVIRAVTTFQGNDLIKNERSMTRENLFMNRDLRVAFAPMIGQINVNSTATVINALKMKGDEWAANGYIIPNDSSERVWDITVSVDGDKIFLTFSRYLTAPTNFVFVTVTNAIYTSTVQL